MGKAADKTPKYTQIMNYLNDKYEFRFNTVAIDLEFTLKGKNEWKPLIDAKLNGELFREGFTGFDKQLNALLNDPDFRIDYNPITDFFQSLPKWDGETDYIIMLADYVTTTDQPFWREQFKKMLVRMIAQVFGTIGFNKQCVTLFSKQNDGKTYFWEYLVKDTVLWDYYKKNPDIIGKESKRALAENFLLNLDELSALTKQDVNQVKATFAESQIKVRLPYDRKDSIMSRKASFVGSTNKREFLVDETGNVRWVVFEIMSINHNEGEPGGYVDVDIRKVWAQAYSLFLAKYPVQLSNDELKHSEANNEAYAVRSVEYQMIVEHFVPATLEEGGQYYQPYNIAEILTAITGNKIRVNEMNVGRACTKLGIERKAKRIGHTVVYGYWLKRTTLDLDGNHVTPVEPQF